jgi:uncharacterized protein (DUF1015 family)
MAILHPFAATRPTAEFAKAVSSVPYDVVSVAEARELAHGNPRSFLHVIRPEINFEEAIDEHDDRVYTSGAEQLRSFVAADYTVTDDEPGLYIYRLILDGRWQTGIFGCVSVVDYDNNIILKHENTRPDKEDDRTRHIVQQRAHAEPVMLTYKDHSGVGEVVRRETAREPDIDFTAADGVQHSLWLVGDASELVTLFRSIPHLYVADGHHRCKAASRAAQTLSGSGASPEIGFFPAVLFPMGDMKILPYNRTIRKLPRGATSFLDELSSHFPLRTDADPTPAAAGDLSLYLDGRWYGLTLPASKREGADSLLDVARLGEHLLEPLLGISNPRTDPNIDFVGGIRGVEELRARVDRGDAALAISMFATSIEDLVSVSDAGLLMPPKSTWFEPKLRSGLLVHLF